MKETTAFVTGCATAGAVVVLMLLVKAGAGTSANQNQVRLESQAVEVQPVQLPPPPTVPNEVQTDPSLERELQQQRAFTERLYAQLQQQQAITDDIRAQLERQQDDTSAILEELRDYQQSVEVMSAQQAHLAEAIPKATSNAQTTLMWGILGLFVLLLVGGAAFFTVFAIWLLQNQRQPKRSTVMYPVQVPTPYASPYTYYYDRQTLPPAAPPQRVVQYDVQDFAD